MTLNKDLISIALCTYNGDRFLERQLESLLVQTYSNLQIIIVDDASIDNTPIIIKKFAKRDQRLKVFFNDKNIGFNANFSKAIEQCSGNYIAICDQDDIWEPNKIEILYERIGDSKLVYHDSIFIDENDRLTGKKMSDLHRFVNNNCSDLLLFHNCVSGHACLLKKELIKIAMPFPKGIYYDWWLAFTASCLGEIDYIKIPLVRHRRHSESFTMKDKESNLTKRIHLLTLFEGFYLIPPTTRSIVGSLKQKYESKSEFKFSLKLFLELLKNRHKIFFIRKKSPFAQLKFIFREASL